jgi:catechol 2,3-dioxygenase-like lactoylglutathione lyase family enzyme
MQPTLTHMALHVKDLDANISFYERFAGMSKIRYWEDTETGMRTAWLRCIGSGERFVLVLLEGIPKQFINAAPQPPIGPLSHLGFALESREAVNKIAALGNEAGVLLIAPNYVSEIVGYLCYLIDPNGHSVEFSYGQILQ